MNGYATEAADLSLTHAFEGLGVHKVSAVVVEGNDASMRVLENWAFNRKASYESIPTVSANTVIFTSSAS